ncbi:MAG: peptide deformylase [Candidatus Melainabacteria bacterium]|jgi:peptide deformylase|uniref:Peptide deformylase n=1 Tax=Candidatus Obscuribacter phosphatis TaxID=1906157 RepID=A0A8J7TK12_9BACT|nr:peptide deformylase [Candidatus Obscuribacter phosphatis]MCA0313619.1 peptide deformylase [Candidatus Melainabacteria bacterium]OPZ82545.1 MAG: Peptide deformylase [bacterium ADurb.Bin425]
MSVLKLRIYPDPVLKQKARKITIIDGSVRKLAQDMLDTMYKSDGVGLAAPQVGVSKRIMVIDVSSEEEPAKPIVFINPEILEKDGEMIGQEGCLSFPDVFFEVKRASKVVVRFQNLKGQTLKLTAEGNLLSRAIQHEIDHLDGKLFIEKATNELKRDLEMTKAGLLDGDAEEISKKLGDDEGLTLTVPSKEAVTS